MSVSVDTYLHILVATGGSECSTFVIEDPLCFSSLSGPGNVDGQGLNYDRHAPEVLLPVDLLNCRRIVARVGGDCGGGRSLGLGFALR